MANKQTPNQTQAQIQGTGNPLGIAAVLLQGAQGKFRILQPAVGFGAHVGSRLAAALSREARSPNSLTE